VLPVSSWTARLRVRAVLTIVVEALPLNARSFTKCLDPVADQLALVNRALEALVSQLALVPDSSSVEELVKVGRAQGVDFWPILFEDGVDVEPSSLDRGPSFVKVDFGVLLVGGAVLSLVLVGRGIFRVARFCLETLRNEAQRRQG